MTSNSVPSLKDKAAERGLDPKLVEIAGKTDDAIRKGIDKAGTIAVEHRGKVDTFLDQAASKIDAKTGGKYHSHIVTVREQVGKGVDKIAEQAVAAKAAQHPGDADPFATDAGDVNSVYDRPGTAGEEQRPTA